MVLLQQIEKRPGNNAKMLDKFHVVASQPRETAYFTAVTRYRPVLDGLDLAWVCRDAMLIDNVTQISNLFLTECTF